MRPLILLVIMSATFAATVAFALDERASNERAAVIVIDAER